MPARQMLVLVLDFVQMLDQQIGLARCITQQVLNLKQHGWIDTSSFRSFSFALLGICCQGYWDNGMLHKYFKNSIWLPIEPQAPSHAYEVVVLLQI